MGRVVGRAWRTPGPAPKASSMEAQPNAEHPRKKARLGPRESKAPRVVADSVTTAKTNAPAIAAARPTATSSTRAISRAIEKQNLKEPPPRPRRPGIGGRTRVGPA